MIYYKVVCHVDTLDEEILSEFYFENGCLGTEILEKPQELPDRFGEIYTLNPDDYPSSGVILIGYFTNPELVSHLRQFLKEKSISLLEDFMIDTVNADYETVRIEFRRTKIGDSLEIIPAWEETPSDNKTYVKILPGFGFGTGSHPSTRLALQGLVKYCKDIDTLLDWGCGSGILAITAKKLGAKKSLRLIWMTLP